jgi:hypothetical protein
MPRKVVKRLAELPSASARPVVPPLEAEAPHRRLARLSQELVDATQAIQDLRKTWAAKNIKAQSVRQTISTPEITHYETRKRELALRIQSLQTGIGETNRELRERKAERQATKSAKATTPALAPAPKTGPIRNHPAFDQYFHLAARNELTPALYAQVERTARAMIADAFKMGLED